DRPYHFQQRRFAGTGRASQEHELAPHNRQINVGERLAVARILFGHILKFDHGIDYAVSPSKASAKACASNGWRSSIFSPTPMKYTGTGLALTIAASTPPLAVPSSLVTIRPVNPSASSKDFTCASAFCPVLPSITSNISCGADSMPL